MFKRIAAISLALLVFLSSTGYSISAHLCGGQRVSYSLFGRPDGCGMDEERQEKERCTHPLSREACSLETRKCCSEQTVVVPGLQHQAELAKRIFALPIFTETAVAAVCFPWPAGFISSIKPPLFDYHPPPRVRDLLVLLQIFRN